MPVYVSSSLHKYQPTSTQRQIFHHIDGSDLAMKSRKIAYELDTSPLPTKKKNHIPKIVRTLYIIQGELNSQS